MGWKKWNKAPTRKPPDYTWNAEEMKMISYVIKKGIKKARIYGLFLYLIFTIT